MRVMLLFINDSFLPVQRRFIYRNQIVRTVLAQHWHAFALSAQIHICYTEDAQKHIKQDLVASRRPDWASAFWSRQDLCAKLFAGSG